MWGVRVQGYLLNPFEKCLISKVNQHLRPSVYVGEGSARMLFCDSETSKFLGVTVYSLLDHAGVPTP